MSQIEFRSLFGNIAKTLRLFPFILLVAQLPEACLSLVQKFTEGTLNETPILGFLILFPLFCISSTLSGGLTFLIILQEQEGKKPSLKEAWFRIKKHLLQLLLAALTVGAFFVLGLAALILPALYFMAIYLFVPQLILTSEKKPLSAVLFESKQMVKATKKTLLNTMCLILFTIVIGLLAYLAGQKLGEAAAALIPNSSLQGVLSTVLDMLCSMAGGCLIDVWISHFFLTLRKRNQGVPVNV